jgi:tetratricopeptide (TPR) repeat protein
MRRKIAVQEKSEDFMKFKKLVFILIQLFCLTLLLSASPNETTYLRPRLAVYCFENETGNENLEYLGSVIQEWILADLSQSKHLHVIEGKRTIHPGISHILSGSYGMANDGYLISATIRNSRAGDNDKTMKAECTALEDIPLYVDKLTTEVKAWLNLTPDQISDDPDRDVGQITTISPQAFRHFCEGRKYLIQGKEKEAVSCFRKALEIDPAFALAHWKMGMAFRPQSIFSYAKKNDSLLKAMELPQRLSERAILRLKGDYHAMTRYRYAQALEAYKKLLTLYPDDEKGHYDLGILYLDIEEWEKAASQFRIVVEAGEQRPGPYLNLARAYMNPGLNDKAQKILVSYLQNIGDSVNIRIASALVHRFKGEYELAHKAVDEAISLYPGVASCYAAKGDIHLYSGDLDKAEAEYQKLIEHEKTEFQDLGLYRLAELYLLMGRFKESRALAKKGFERAQKRGNKGTMRDRLSFSASLDSLTGHPQDAMKKLDALWRTCLEDEELEWQRFVVYRKGLVHAETGRLNRALEEAKRLEGLIAQGLDKKKMRLFLHLMGIIELKRKNYPKAIEHLEKSLPMICVRSRLNIAVADTLASAYSGIGDLEGARKEYERIATFPRGRQFYGDVFAKSYYRLGKIYETAGQNDKALENYGRFLEIWKDADPDMPEIEEARRRFHEQKK